MIWKDFFFFSKGEKNGLLVLGSLICLMFAVNFCFPSHSQNPNEAVYTQEEQRKIDSLILEIRYRDSLLNKERSKRTASVVRDSFSPVKQEANRTVQYNNLPPKKLNRGVAKHEVLKIELNKADSAELVKLRGIGPVLAKRIIRYRTSLGGKFHSVEELRNVYGLSEETFQSIKPYLWIDTLLLK